MRISVPRRIAQFASILSCVTLTALILAGAAYAALGDLSIVSRADGTAGSIADGNAYTNARASSADGRYVVFISYANNLGGSTNGDRQVYRRDTLLGRTELVSRATGLAGAVGDDTSFAAAVSADGNFVVFASGADNLSILDNDAYSNIYLRDIAAGTTTLVSRASTGAPYNGAAANASSIGPVISGDGTIIAFQTAASNLDGTMTDNNAASDVYVRDLAAQTTRLISKTTGGTIGNGLTGTGDISFDGRMVTMDTESDNLGGTVSGSSAVYVRDRQTNTTTLVSQASGTSNVSSDDVAGNSTISDDGTKIAFIGRATNLVAGSPSNRYFGFLRDLSTNATSIVSTNSAGELPNADIGEATIASDASGISFNSEATNIDGPPPTDEQAFHKDFASGQTMLVSRVGRDGAPATGSVSGPTLGRSSNFLLFSTNAANLVAEPTGGVYEVFRRDIKVVDPIPPVTLTGKRFTAKVSRSRFAVKVGTTNGPTGIAGTATIRTSKRIVRSGKIVVKYKLRAISATRSSHKITFKLSKRQNKLVLRALKTKRSRLKVTVALVASKPGSQATRRISGKLRR